MAASDSSTPVLLGDSLTPSQSGSSLPSLNSSDTSSDSNSGDKPWKRASTLEEVRQSSTRWSLAADAGLLLYLKKFSQNLLLRTHELEKNVDDLVHDTKGMGSKLHNTFNDFLMLSNKQFIENRVYDEEISQDDTQEKSQQPAKTREQLESEVLPRYSEAVNCGFQVLDDAFITVEIKAADESDEDEGLPAGYVPDPIIEAKDMYASRPLPHLIGTAEFFSDETLGLIETDEEEEQVNKSAGKDEEESESDEESETESETESEYSESSEEELPKKTVKKVASDESDSEEESDSDEELFGDSKKKPEYSDESESETEEVTTPRSKHDMQAELAAKLGIKQQTSVPTKNEGNDDDDKTETKSITSRKTVDNESIKDESIGNSENSKKEKKHHSKGTKSTGEHKHHHKHHHHHHHHEKKSLNEEVDITNYGEFVESDEDLFGESKQKDSFEDKGLFSKKGGLFSGGGTLFDEEHQNEDNDGNLFGDNEAGTKEDFTDEKKEDDNVPTTPSEIKPRTRTTSSGKKIPAGAVSLFGENPQLFGPSSTTKEPTIKEEVVGTKPGLAKKPPTPVKGLFDDGDSEQLFADKSNNLQEPPKTRRKKTLELFDDEDSLFENKSDPSQNKPVSESKKQEDAKGKKTPISSDSTSLFADDSKAEVKSPPTTTKKSTTKPKVISLFDDDGEEEGDWFDSMKPSNSKTPETPKINVEQTSEPSQDSNALFNKPPQPSSNATTMKKDEPKKPSKSKKVVSLFDDDEDDLFGAVSTSTTKETKQNEPVKKEDHLKTPNEKPKEKKHPKTKSFLDDTGNGLFGNDQEDLFSDPQKATPVKTEEKKAEKPKSKPKKPASAISFLDDEDDDEDDGFFSIPKKGDKKEEVKKEHIKKEEVKKEQIKKEEVTKEQIKKEEPKKEDPKKEKPSKGILNDDDDDDDLFTNESKPKGDSIDGGNTEREEKSKVEEDEEPVEKPKRLAGAVSLFGGIDPFAAKNKLKHHHQAEQDDELFGSKKSPTVNEKHTPSEDKNIHKKEPVAIPTAKHEDNQPQPTKTETPKKVKPTIVFNPATMLPGATPPVKNIEEAVLSFDQPAAVTTLHHANKDRAKVQNKRRPPTRRHLQTSAAPTIEPSNLPSTIPSLDTTDGLFSKPVESRTSSAADNSLKTDTERKSTQKLTVGDDISDNDDEDALFSSSKLTSSGKSKDNSNDGVKKPEISKPAVDDIFATPKSVAVASKPIVTPVENRNKNASVDDDDDRLFGSDKSVSDNIFGATGTPSSSETKSSQGPKNIADHDIFNDVPKKSNRQERVDNVEEDDLIGAAQAQPQQPSKTKSETKIVEHVSEEAEDLFAAPKKEKEPIKKEKEVTKKEKEATKPKKNKSDNNMFKDDLSGDIFSSEKEKKSEKKEAAKKTKKSSRVVTDDDLFGDTGSIFSDLPAKSKEKKKKKVSTGKDIFAKNDEDIFASGGEKKAKTKKKTEKATKTKTAISSSADQKNAADIFNDPLNALGAD
eukprot:gene11036-12201_t